MERKRANGTGEGKRGIEWGERRQEGANGTGEGKRGIEWGERRQEGANEAEEGKDWRGEGEWKEADVGMGRGRAERGEWGQRG